MEYKIRKQVDYLEKRPKVDAIFTYIKIIDKGNNEIKNNSYNTIFHTPNKSRIEWLRFFLTKGNCLCISSAVLIHSVLTKVGNFNESLVQLSDLDLWVRIAGISEIYVL